MLEQTGLRPDPGIGDALAIDPGIGGALAAMADDVLAQARCVVATIDDDEAVAVHELRKALKRWRALLRLLAPIVGEEADTLRRDARDLARLLASARDSQSALDALADVVKLTADAPGALSARSLATMRGRLVSLRQAAETAALNAETRARIAGTLEAATRRVPQWALASVRFRAVARELTAAYARARAGRPPDWQAADAEALHAWRQQVVVHRYQMVLVEPLWPRFGRLWISEAQRLRDRLGACQDLTVLLALTAPHQPLAPWRSRLVPLAETAQATHLASAARLGGRLFAETPKAFRKRLGALWKNRRTDAALAPAGADGAGPAPA